MLKRSALAFAVLASTTLSGSPGSAASFIVNKGFWGDSSTTGSFAWAIDQANLTPGFDSIYLTTNVNISDYPGFPLPTRLANITDPAGLEIAGFGHSLIGEPNFITPSGVNHTKTNPQQFLSGDVLTGSTYSFARVADNVSNVLVRDLVVDGLNTFMTIGQGSTVTIQRSEFKYMGYFGIHPASVFEANADSTLNLSGVTIQRVNNFQKPIVNFEYLWFPAIAGNNASLNMENSILDVRISSVAGAISWAGGIANVVSSQILGQGLSIADNAKEGVLNVVNSIFRPYDHSATARIQAFNGGVANVIASTVQFDAFGTTDIPIGKPGAAGCPLNYKCNGAPLQAMNGGTINLESSAIAAIHTNFIDEPYSNTYGGTFGTLTADALSFVQPGGTQDATALKTLFGQPNLLTSGIPYALDPISYFVPIYYNLPGGAEPLAPGPLLNIVADADGANKLINPIDGSVITTDVFGNPRTANGLRDVGAVQASVPGPLPVLGCGAAFGWSRRLRRRIQQGAA